MPSRPGICSISLGRVAAGHTLEHRLDMAQIHGFKGIELFHEDLVSVAEQAHMSSLPSHKSAQTFKATPAQELAAAYTVRIMCAERGLTIICLQPFWQYEGLLDRLAHYDQLHVKLPLWLKLANALGTDMIQVPSNFLPADQLTTDFNLAVTDLRRMADAGLAFAGLDPTGNPLPITTTSKDNNNNNNDGLGEHRVIRFAYEALAWGTRCDTWEQAWATVQAVDRPNFGLLLDTFNLAGSRVFADPASPLPLGLVPNAHDKLRNSLARLAREVDVNKVFYVQIASAEKLAEPLVPGHELYDANQPARMSWSRSCRLFYGEEGVFGGTQSPTNTTIGDSINSSTFLHNAVEAAMTPPGSDIDSAITETWSSTAAAAAAAAAAQTGNKDDQQTRAADEEKMNAAGEYLPVADVARAIFQDLGFRGWVSHEVFCRRAWDRDENVPAELAGRAAYSWVKLCASFEVQKKPAAAVVASSCSSSPLLPPTPPTHVASSEGIFVKAGKEEKQKNGETDRGSRVDIRDTSVLKVRGAEIDDDTDSDGGHKAFL
ncbi:TIM barrel protein [Microdochium nivale]|nr:TIM barrel protein [Microdochium nivale]